MKPRNHVVRDMLTNGLYRAKVEKSKKDFRRKPKHLKEIDYDYSLCDSKTKAEEKIC